MWFPLCKVEKDQEVQGEIHLEVTKLTYNDRHVINIKIIEARSVVAMVTRKVRTNEAL